MNNLKNWKEITKGLYRYVIAANLAYEIHVLFWDHDTDVLTAKSSLFLIGDWKTKDGKSTTERECILREQPLFECLNEAVKDNDENNN